MTTPIPIAYPSPRSTQSPVVLTSAGSTRPPVTSLDRIGPDVPAGCPSVLTGRRLGVDAAAVVAVVEYVLCDPGLASLLFDDEVAIGAARIDAKTRG